MTITALNDIESQFTHLSREDQLALLERLVHQMRQASARVNGHSKEWVETSSADPRFRQAWDQPHADFKAAATDLLSEAG